MSVVFPLSLARLVALFCVCAGSLQAGDWPQRLSDPELADRSRNDSTAAFGNGWLAVRESDESLAVFDSADGEELLRLGRPQDHSPENPLIFETLAHPPLARGDRLITLWNANRTKPDFPFGETMLVLVVWTIPGSEPPVMQIIPETIQDGFFGRTDPGQFAVSDHRISLFLSSSFPEVGYYLHWDLEQLEPGIAIPLPNGTRLPPTSPSYDGYAEFWSGEKWLCYTDRFQRNEIVVVDFEDQSVSTINTTEQFSVMHGSLIPSGYGDILLMPLQRREVTGGQPFVGYFDLAEGRLVKAVPLVGASGSNNLMISAGPDGVWWAFNGTSEIHAFRGDPDSLQSGGGIPLGVYPSREIIGNQGYPFALSDGYLWMTLGGHHRPGEFANRIPFSHQLQAAAWIACDAATEGDGISSVSVRLSQALEHDATLRVEVHDGTAVVGGDFRRPPREIRIPAGMREAEFGIPLVGDDQIEPDEYFTLEAHDPDERLLVIQPETSCVILGSKFGARQTIESWMTDDVSSRPQDIRLAGDVLVQTNRSGLDYMGNAPKVMTRTLIGGEWKPAAAWADDNLDFWDWIGIIGSEGDTVLVADRRSSKETATVFSARTGSVLTRIEDLWSRGAIAVDSRSFLYRKNGSNEGLWQVPLDGGEESSAGAEQSPSSAAYTARFIVELESLKTIRLRDRTSVVELGEIFPDKPMPMTTIQKIAGEGERLMLLGDELLVCDLAAVVSTESSMIVPSVLLRSPADPDAVYKDADIWESTIAAARESDDGSAVVDFFDASSGTWIGMTECRLPVEEDASTWIRNLSGDSENMIVAIDGPEEGKIFHLSVEGRLPGYSLSDVVYESGSGISVELNEAANFELVVEARVMRDSSPYAGDWDVESAEAVVPPGKTVAHLPLDPRNDLLANGERWAWIEVKLSGGGLYSTDRQRVRVIDDDSVEMGSFVLRPFPLTNQLHPFGQGWAGEVRNRGYGRYDSLRWSDNVHFADDLPLLPEDTTVDFGLVGAANGWVAIRTAPIYGATLNSGLPAQLVMYRPHDPEAPAHLLKGTVAIDNFAQDVCIGEEFYWVGVPGIGPASSTLPRAGLVRRYSLESGGFPKTIRPSAEVKWEFGWSLLSNGRKLWVASPSTRLEEGSGVWQGAISQYDASSSTLERIIWEPEGDHLAKEFGTRMHSASELLLVRVRNSYFGSTLFAFSEKSGELRWSLSGPQERDILDPEKVLDAVPVGDRILAVGRMDGLMLYALSEAWSEPQPLFHLRWGGQGVVRSLSLGANGPFVAVHLEKPYTELPESFLLDLRQIQRLWPYLGTGDDARDWSVLFEKGKQSLSIAREKRRWVVRLPAGLIPPDDGKVMMECSNDLESWAPVVELDHFGEWTPVWGPESDFELIGGDLLRYSGQSDGCFLRFHQR